MLADERRGSALLDCPVGTGRFLALYRRLGLEATGVDSSEEMLSLARKKRLAVALTEGHADNLNFADGRFRVVVCVRFLDLIEEEAMRAVTRELARVCGHTLVLTIRLGEKYVLKSNTATHDERKFRRLMATLGFELTDDVPIFKAGWRVMRWRRT